MAFVTLLFGCFQFLFLSALHAPLNPYFLVQPALLSSKMLSAVMISLLPYWECFSLVDPLMLLTRFRRFRFA